MTSLPLIFLNATVLAYALLAGVFLAFSDFIMRALAETPAPGGAAAMQSINRAVFRTIFMVLFIGMVPVSGLLVFLGLSSGAVSFGGWSLAAGLLYILSCFATTAARNVPMNNALEAMDATTTEAETYWQDIYRPQWTRWNTVRAIACLACAIMVLVEVNVVN